MRFLILTAARSGEVRGARWSEIDLAARTWTVPAERMKGRREHVVPLADAALAVLRDAEAIRDDTGLVFPSARGKVAIDSVMRLLLRDLGIAAAVHGFRTSFRTWAAERTNTPREIAELALAHAVGSTVERAYSRSDLPDKRRTLMNKWAAYLTQSTADVVRLHA